MLVAAASLGFLFCVGFKFRKTIVITTRYSVFALLIFIFLLKDIFSDFITDFWKNKDEPVSLPDEVAVITGGARGIGVDVVRKLMRSGATVVVGCRDVSAGERLLEEIRREGLTTGNLKSFHLDLTNITSVQTFAVEILNQFPNIHILINNAGITNMKRELTKDGVEMTFAVNYLNHFYLTHLLLPRLVATGRTSNRKARIVNVTSCVHSYPFIGDLHIQDLTLKGKYQEHIAYGQSKTAQVMFTKTLEEKLREKQLPVQVHGVHPGVVMTFMMTKNLLHMVMPWFFPFVLRTSESAARTVYYACASPRLESNGGTYICSSEVSPTGGATNSKAVREQLWRKSLHLLGVEEFGDLLK